MKLNNMETQYIKKDNGHTYYYADKEMTVLHRLGSPAIEHADGSKMWWVKGKRHRIDGPAEEYADGYKEWWVEGKFLTEADFKMLHELKEITLEQIAEKFGIELSKLRIKPN